MTVSASPHLRTSSFGPQLSLVHFTGPPKIHSTGFSPDLSLGDDTAAVCVAKREAGGSLSVIWQKDGVELKSDSQITVSNTASTSTLTIRRIRPEDIGNYTCTATNTDGSSEVIIPLVVIGKQLSISKAQYVCNTQHLTALYEWGL